MCSCNFEAFRLTSYLKKSGAIRSILKYIKPDLIPNKTKGSGAKQLVFVTGIHRSGTSWIGDIMSYAEDVSYWREPYNPSTVKNMAQQYLYLPDNVNETSYKIFTDKMLQGKYSGSLFDYTLPKYWYGLSNKHLIKDPTAAFMLEWIMSEYNCKTLVVLRHPAGFVSSVLKLNWDFDFNCFLKQKKLMSKYLVNHRDIIEKYNYPGMDVGKGAVLWCVVYHVLKKMTISDDVIWVKYEDVCASPISSFKNIHQQFDLQWNESIENKIKDSVSGRSTFSNNITHELSRDTSKMSTIWKTRLSQDELDLIDDITCAFGFDEY